MNETNDRHSDAMDFAELEQLFATARVSAPELNDANFTKMVMNSLPAHTERINTARLRYDLLGTIAGGLMALLLVDFRSLFALVWQQGITTSTALTGQVVESVALVNSASVASESIVISLSTIIGALVIASAASLLAWFAVEKAQSPF